MISEVLGSFCVISSISWNYYVGRPVYAQLYRTLLAGGLGYGIGYTIQSVYERRKRVRLHAIEHYKQLFPERVPHKDLRTYNDIMQPWEPKR